MATLTSFVVFAAIVMADIGFSLLGLGCVGVVWFEEWMAFTIIIALFHHFEDGSRKNRKPARQQGRPLACSGRFGEELFHDFIIPFLSSISTVWNFGN
jgi:hypothetical protein